MATADGPTGRYYLITRGEDDEWAAVPVVGFENGKGNLEYTGNGVNGVALGFAFAGERAEYWSASLSEARDMASSFNEWTPERLRLVKRLNAAKAALDAYDEEQAAAAV